MIYLTVGTFPGGFDRLVKAIDKLCGKHKVGCTAQIGTSSYKPANISYNAFYDSEQHLSLIAQSRFVITHGGFGVIGDIMRLHKPMLVVPRKPEEGPNDQRQMAERLTDMYELNLCMDIDDIERPFINLLASTTNTVHYNLGSDIPQIIGDFLECTK